MGKPESFQNVFDALDLSAVDELSAKSELAAKFINVLRERGFSHEDAARAIGTTASRVKMVCCADLDDFTTDDLLRFLVTLGQHTEIGVPSD